MQGCQQRLQRGGRTRQAERDQGADDAEHLLAEHGLHAAQLVGAHELQDLAARHDELLLLRRAEVACGRDTERGGGGGEASERRRTKRQRVSIAPWHAGKVQGKMAVAHGQTGRARERRRTSWAVHRSAMCGAAHMTTSQRSAQSRTIARDLNAGCLLQRQRVECALNRGHSHGAR